MHYKQMLCKTLIHIILCLLRWHICYNYSEKNKQYSNVSNATFPLAIPLCYTKSSWSSQDSKIVYVWAKSFFISESNAINHRKNCIELNWWWNIQYQSSSRMQLTAELFIYQWIKSTQFKMWTFWETLIFHNYILYHNGEHMYII